MVEFEWDGAKAASNLAKHGVSFEEALTVFDDPLAVIFEDGEHSHGELRELIIGHSYQNRLVWHVSPNDPEECVSSTLDQPPEGNVRIMKRTPASDSGESNDDMKPEYRFDYSKAKPNRFANVAQKRRVAIVLDEDVAEVFATTESVNKALRAFIEAMPAASGRREP